MNLDKELSQKVEAKEIKQAEEATKLEDVLKQKAEAKEKEAEETRLAELRQSIIGLDGKTDQMQKLLTELQGGHEQAVNSVVKAKKEGKDLAKATAEIDKLFANEKFRLLLAEEGINSTEDLFNSESYSGHEQVLSVKGLRQAHAENRQKVRETISTRGKIKKEAHKTIIAERSNEPPKFSYPEIVRALEEIITLNYEINN